MPLKDSQADHVLEVEGSREVERTQLELHYLLEKVNTVAGVDQKRTASSISWNCSRENKPLITFLPLATEL